MRRKQVLLIVGWLAALIVVGLIDSGLYRLRLRSSSTFHYEPFLAASIGANLLVGALLFIGGWMALRWRQPLRLAGAGLILLGLFIVFYPILFFGGILRPLGLRLSIRPLLISRPHLPLAGGFTAVVGLYLAFRPARLRSE